MVMDIFYLSILTCQSKLAFPLKWQKISYGDFKTMYIYILGEPSWATWWVSNGSSGSLVAVSVGRWGVPCISTLGRMGSTRMTTLEKYESASDTMPSACSCYLAFQLFFCVYILGTLLVNDFCFTKFEILWCEVVPESHFGSFPFASCPYHVDHHWWFEIW